MQVSFSSRNKIGAILFFIKWTISRIGLGYVDIQREEQYILLFVEYVKKNWNNSSFYYKSYLLIWNFYNLRIIWYAKE